MSDYEIQLILDVPIDERHWEDFQWIDEELGEDERASEMLADSVVDESFTIQVEDMIHQARQQLKVGRMQEEEQREQIEEAAQQFGLDLSDDE